MGELRNSKIYHFGPLLSGDIAMNLYLALKQLPGIKIIDVQGLVRQVREDNVIWQSNKDVRTILSNFDIIKCDQAELNYITNSTNYNKSIDQLMQCGIQEIIVTNGSHGSTIYSKSEGELNIPSFKPNRFKRYNWVRRHFYSNICLFTFEGLSYLLNQGCLLPQGPSLKIEHIGPLSTSIEHIKEKIEKHYKQRSLQLIA